MKQIFDDLYERYHQDMYKYVFYLVKNREQTEDIIQEVYIRVLKSYHTFKGDSSEKTWLFSIARHVTLDHFRKMKRKRDRVLEFFNWNEHESNIKSTEPIPEEVAIKNEEAAQLYQSLNVCTNDQKQVILLRFLYDFSIDETAKILGFSISKVKTTQHRALKILKKYYNSTYDKEGEDFDKQA
ncbi:RNA polymerase sigma factor SigX [Gracilibacillus marinus]|uniref:RNA polymerase sigma factor n=1 Tax=Gracilibacillus marinus TaxID=630535 RepID=A0ABV8VT83_9BACI